jgi:PPP family 3-phenylpropionic acid transporter
MRVIWPFSFYFLYFAGIASLTNFVVLHFQKLDFTGAQIGLLTGIGPLVTLFTTPLWTRLADVTRRHRLVMSLTLGVCSVMAALMPLISGFAPVLLALLLYSAFFAPISSLADSATMVMLAEEDEMYGRVRLGSTIGYGLAALAAGVLVELHGTEWTFWGCSLSFFLALLVSQRLEHGEANPAGQPAADLATLLRNRRWVLVMALSAASGMALAGVNSYFGPYLKELGAKESLIGLAVMMGMISEIPVLLFANRLVRQLKPQGLLTLTIAVTAARLLLLSAVGLPELALLSQLLNGLTFPATWVAIVSYAHRNAPPGLRATAQGVLGASPFALGNAAGGFVGGLLLERTGGRGMYFVLGSVVLVVVVTVAFIQRRLSAAAATSAHAVQG